MRSLAIVSAAILIAVLAFVAGLQWSSGPMAMAERPPSSALVSPGDERCPMWADVAESEAATSADRIDAGEPIAALEAPLSEAQLEARRKQVVTSLRMAFSTSGDLGRALGLSEDQTDRFLEARWRLRGDGLDAPSAAARLDSEFGNGVAARFEEFVRSAPARRTVTALQVQLIDADHALTKPQMQKLVELYTRVRVDPSVGTLGYSNDLPSDRVADLQTRIERQERNDQTLEAEAISIIDSAQMSVVHAYHQHQIAPQRAALETLRANLAR